MGGFDLFEFYRFLLAVLVGCYCTIRLVVLIWRWESAAGSLLGSAVLRRYVAVLLLRLRFRRFVYELSVIGGLAVVLVLLIRMHWR